MDNNVSNIISRVIDMYGKDILSDNRFLNILNDYHAFNDNQPLKHIFKVIIDYGFVNRWLNLETDVDARLVAARDTDIIVKEFGLKGDLVENAIHILLNALGHPLTDDSTQSDNFFGKQREMLHQLVPFQISNECSHYCFRCYVLMDNNTICYDRYGIAYSEDGKAVVVNYDDIVSSYTIRKGTAFIADNAFSNFKESVNLSKISIPGTVIGIGYSAFENANLSNVVIPESVKYIGNGAFRNNKLKIITLSENIEYIGNDAFRDNMLLNNVKLPESIVILGYHAFDGTSIESVILPKNLKMLWGRSVFPQDTEIINNSLYLVFKDGMVYNQDMSILFACFSTEKVIHIIDAVEEIGQMAFEDCTTIETVILGDNVKRIGHSAFSGCKNLKMVQCNSKLETIEFDAFDNCSSLASFTIPCSVRTIESGAFNGCDFKEIRNLSKHIDYIDGALYCEYCLIDYMGTAKKVIVKEGTEIIGSGAFYKNKHIEEVVLPKSVIEIESEAFWGCTRLKKINVNKKKCEVEYDAFENTIFANKFNR